jgi:hypothetical protein
MSVYRYGEPRAEGAINAVSICYVSIDFQEWTFVLTEEIQSAILLQQERRNVDKTYALVALAPSIALTMVKSSSFICATIVLGAKTPAAKSAAPNSVPAAYSETNDGIVVVFRKKFDGGVFQCVYCELMKENFHVRVF